MAGQEDVKVGKKIIVEGIPYEVVKAEHLKVAMGKGMEKCTIKNLLTGKVIPKTFREVDPVEPANINYFSSEYTYHDGDGFHFMNSETYEEVLLSDEKVGESKYFLIE
jgi:elongation factor P